jgi:riboflavin synthase
MFTGIITGIGQILSVHDWGDSAAHGKKLCIEAPSTFLDDVGLGDSIALNGACMTVTELDLPKRQFSITISAESLDKTTGLAVMGRVNLEKALRAHDRLGGHIVTGHVDGLGQVSHFAEVGESWCLRVLCPKGLSRFFATKGSATINGVSLTTNRVHDLPPQEADQEAHFGAEIEINLIPHTLTHTTLGELQVGDAVNLEIDVIARYCERMLQR